MTIVTNITISGQTYAAKPVRKYAMQFLGMVFLPDGTGGYQLNIDIDACAPLLEVIAEDICPPLAGLIGFNRSLNKYYWRGETEELVELCGEVSRLYYLTEIDRLNQAKEPNQELIAVTRKSLDEIVLNLDLLRGDVSEVEYRAKSEEQASILAPNYDYTQTPEFEESAMRDLQEGLKARIQKKMADVIRLRGERQPIGAMEAEISVMETTLALLNKDMAIDAIE